MRRKTAVILVLMLIISLFSGCGRTIKTKDGSISVKNGNLEIKDKDGGTTTIKTSDDKKGESLPDKYPKNAVPIIDGANIVYSSKNTKDGKDTFSVIYECKKEMKDATDYYKKVMEGTKDSNNMEAEEMVILTGTKDKYKVSIAVTAMKDKEKDAKSTVTIGIEEQ